MELLAPAGNLEAGVGAFHYGADAVYLGMREFSARADADNFTLDELSVLLGIAHQDRVRPRRVYVAINTLVKEAELPGLIDLLAQLRDLAVDALIIQDLALYSIIQEHFPEFELHASTQMAIHNLAGARQAHEMGFRRVIAARELTLAELGEMCDIPNLELEVFVHGALCYAYSGLCLLSACLRGGSGNRGDCAYICRNSFKVQDANGALIDQCAPMSMKDLALPELIPSLRRCGVASLKIEGRKKTPLYIAAMTNYYRKLMDGTFAPDEQARCERDIKTIFSRPWTTLYTRNARSAAVTTPYSSGPSGVEVGTVAAVTPGTPDRLRFVLKNQGIERYDGLQIELPEREKPFGFGIEDLRVFSQRGHESGSAAFSAEPESTIEVALPAEHPPIPVGARISCSSSQAVKRSYDWPTPRPSLCRSRHPVYFELKIAPRELLVISQPCAGPRELSDIRSSMTLDEPLAPARQPEKVVATAESCFAKLGDTTFTLADLRVSNPQGLFVPTSLLNELRRRAAQDVQDALDKDLGELTSKVIAAIDAWQPPKATASATPAWAIKIDRVFYLNLFSDKELARLDEVIFAIGRTPVNEIPDALTELERLLGGRNRIRLALPAISRDNGSTNWAALIANLFRSGWRRWELSNLGAWQLFSEAGASPRNLNLTADWPMLVCNHLAAKTLLDMNVQRVTLSPEDRWDNWLALLKKLGVCVDVPVYQDTPLALSATCIMNSLKGFCPGKKHCDFTTLTLSSRRDERLVAINDHCQSVIISERPLDLSGHLHELRRHGAGRFRADFLWRDYAPTTVHDIWRKLQLDEADSSAWTANLFRDINA
ncbi:MAG: U32 family peptidase [Lentisphaerae bacterium]|nr:U32 family peptidase [Lentisphaerota bacterium]